MLVDFSLSLHPAPPSRRTYIRICSFAVAISFTLAAANNASAITSLKVMTYNILVGGAQYGPLSRTVGVIQTAQADIIGIQEVGGSAQSIANSLGFFYHGFNSDIAIISRYPIVQVLNQGVQLQLSPTQSAYVFDVHLAPYPYQPYDIRDGLIMTEAQAISAAQATRGQSVANLLSEITPALNSSAPVFLTGDFNEPSHLDWTQAAANAGLHFGKKVDWPTSHSITNAGLSDAFRDLRPDVINDPGNTWTPGSPAPNIAANEVHDRIDFVYYAGANVAPVTAKTLGYNANDSSTDIAVQPYPSDHRAVVVNFNIPGCAIVGDLNGNCSLGVDDWMQFRSGQQIDMTGFSHSQAYSYGDLNGDLRNNHADFVIFKNAYDAVHGAGAFFAMVQSVPEPSALSASLALGAIGLRIAMRPRSRTS
jgi:endonuclease/exonuclease/phosphatase family metal-dependent hydrolase